MSAQHTPGPWVSLGSHESEGFDCYWIKTQPSPMLRGFTKEIAAVTGPQGGEAEANARLIATAPEMAEVLRMANGAINAAFAQAEAEYRDHDKAAAKHDAVVREFRTTVRDLLAKIGGDV